MEPQWGGEKSLKAAEKDHTLTDRVCAFKTSWAECRDQKRCRHRANGGDFSLDIHSYRTILGARPTRLRAQPAYIPEPCVEVTSVTVEPSANAPDRHHNLWSCK